MANTTPNNIIIPFGDKFKQAWDMWKDYKKDTFGFIYKGVYSEQMTLKTVTELSDGDEDKAVRIIEQSIMRQWQGLFPLHTPSTKSNGSKSKSTKQPSSKNNETGSSSTLRDRVQTEIDKRYGDKGYEDGECHLKAV